MFPEFFISIFLNFNFFAKYFPSRFLLNPHCRTSHFSMLLTFSRSWIEFICLFVSLRPLLILIVSLNSVLLDLLPLNLVVKGWHLARSHVVFLSNVSILWHELLMVWIFFLLWFVDFCVEKAFLKSLLSSTTKIKDKIQTTTEQIKHHRSSNGSKSYNKYFTVVSIQNLDM